MHALLKRNVLTRGAHPVQHEGVVERKIVERKEIAIKFCRKKRDNGQIYKQVRNEDAVEYGDLIGEITFPIQQVRDDIKSIYTKSMSFYTKS